MIVAKKTGVKVADPEYIREYYRYTKEQLLLSHQEVNRRRKVSLHSKENITALLKYCLQDLNPNSDFTLLHGLPFLPLLTSEVGIIRLYKEQWCEAANKSNPNATITQLVNMGFALPLIYRAIEDNDNNLDACLAYLFSISSEDDNGNGNIQGMAELGDFVLLSPSEEEVKLLGPSLQQRIVDGTSSQNPF